MKTLIKILCLSVLWFSCENNINGCTNPEACNYYADATSDDNSCFYPEDEDWCDCDGNVLDDCGVCSGNTIEECGSCDYVYLWGDCYNIGITTLMLHEDDLTGPIPSEIGKLINLEWLVLTSNQLTGEIPPEIGNLINLEVLWLFENNLTGEIPIEIGDMTNLIYVNLEHNQLSGDIPPEICNQGDATPILSYNKFCPEYPECLMDEQLYPQDISECP